MPKDPFLHMLVTTLAVGIMGMVLFGLAFWAIVKITPFSIRKEIEEDQNTSLAILIGSVIIGIGLIVASAVHG